MMSTTPGAAFAAARSIERMRACACGRAQEDAVGLPVQDDVVGVLAGAGDEAPVLAPAHALADRALGRIDGFVHVAHGAAPQTAVGVLARLAELDRLDDVVIAGAAADVAVERPRGSLPRSPSGCRRAAAPPTSPCPACRSRTAGRGTRGTPPASGAARRPCARPSIVVIWLPCTCAASIEHDLIARAVHVHGAGAALRGVAADVGAGQLQVLAQELHEQRARVDRPGDGLAVDGEGNGNVHAGLLWVVREAVARDVAPPRGLVRDHCSRGTGHRKEGFPNAAAPPRAGRRRYAAQLRKPKKPSSRSAGAKPRKAALRRPRGSRTRRRAAPCARRTRAASSRATARRRSPDRAGTSSPSTPTRRPSESPASRPGAPPPPTRPRSAAGGRPSGTRPRPRTS